MSRGSLRKLREVTFLELGCARMEQIGAFSVTKSILAKLGEPDFHFIYYEQRWYRTRV